MKNIKALKKKRLVLQLVFVAALLAAAFALKDFPGPEKIPGINAYIKEGTVSPTGLCLVVENKGAKTFCFEDANYIQKRKLLSWDLVWPVHDDYMFRQYPVELGPGESCEVEILWEDCYGGLPKGRYLLSKPALLFDEVKDSYKQRYDLEIAFDIE